MRLTVDVAVAGERLDVFLAIRGAVPSAAAARRAIAAGAVRVDGRREKKGARVRAGQVVELLEAALVEPAAQPFTLDILYEDADIVAVAKPGGVPSHALRADETGTVADALVARFPECAEASPDRREGGLGHRLDRDTSGVLLAARHPEAWRRLRAALGSPDCQKIYLAEVIGRLAPKPETPFVSRASTDAWIVDAPIGRIGRRGGRVRLDGGRNPLPARTQVRVLEERAATTLVEARLSKGRAHQVRAHLACLGAPVVGDDVYGTETNSALHLHALTVNFLHPMTNQALRIQAPPPSWAEYRTVK